MSISELNHFMTYVLDGWMLFSAGFIGISFVSFVSRRIQEDIEADALALAQSMEAAIAQEESISTTEAAKQSTTQAAISNPSAPTPPAPTETPPASPQKPTPDNSPKDSPAAEDTSTDGDESQNTTEEEAAEIARLEEVAAVSEKLTKNRGKQTDTSSVSVST